MFACEARTRQNGPCVGVWHRNGTGTAACVSCMSIFFNCDTGRTWLSKKKRRRKWQTYLHLPQSPPSIWGFSIKPFYFWSSSHRSFSLRCVTHGLPLPPLDWQPTTHLSPYQLFCDQQSVIHVIDFLSLSLSPSFTPLSFFWLFFKCWSECVLCSECWFDQWMYCCFLVCVVSFFLQREVVSNHDVLLYL